MILALALMTCLEQDSEPPKGGVSRLIEGLKNENLAVRDRAEKRLLLAGESALPELRLALRTQNPQWKKRILSVIEKIAWPNWDKLRRFQDPVRRRHILQRRLRLPAGDPEIDRWRLTEVATTKHDFVGVDGVRFLWMLGRASNRKGSGPVSHLYAMEIQSGKAIDLTCMQGPRRLPWLSGLLRKRECSLKTRAQVESVLTVARFMRVYPETWEPEYCRVRTCKHIRKKPGQWKVFQVEDTCRGGYRSFYWILETDKQRRLRSIRLNPIRQSFPHDR